MARKEPDLLDLKRRTLLGPFESGPLQVGGGPVTRPDSGLYGPIQRKVRNPSLALQTVQRLGPVRHALAQRAVCGTMEVHAPWADMLARGEDPKDKGKKK